MNRDAAKQEIRSRIKCTEFLEKSKSGLYCCPFPDCGSGHGQNSTGAVKFYEETNTFFCHACHKGGDVIDLYQQRNGVDYSTALSLMAQEIGITLDPYRQDAKADFAEFAKNAPAAQRQGNFGGHGDIKTPPASKSPAEGAEMPVEEKADYTEYYKLCAERLTDPAAVSYLSARGITIENARAAHWGFDPAADPANAPGAMGDEYRPHPCPRIIIQTSKTHYVGRRIDGKKEFDKMNPKNGKPGIFNLAAIWENNTGAIFVTEGAFNAMSFLEAGANAIATNSASNIEELIKQLEARRTDAILILAFDNDKAGRNATQKLQERLKRLNISFITAGKDITGRGDEVPEGEKEEDANDLLIKDKGAFYEAVQEAEREAAAFREQQQEAERERQERTGASMIDAFLETVRTKKYEPVPTGISDIDRAIGGGFIRQQIILLGAAPGAGKTSLAQWIFEGMAKRGQSCLYLNLEMSREQMLARSISRIAAQDGNPITPTDVLQGYKWDWTQEAAVTMAAEKYKEEIAPRMIYNPDGVTAELDSILEYIETEAQRAEAARLPAPCVVLDYLQIVRGREREDDTAIIKRAMESLKKYAIDHNTFVFVIMANNRAANRTGDVTMESGRDTSALEYGADLQLGLAFTYCLEKAMEKMGKKAKSKDDLTKDEMKWVTLKITKGRWGGWGTGVSLLFDGEKMTFAQAAPEFLEEPQQPESSHRKRI